MIDIVVSTLIPDTKLAQTRFPRSKRRRIRKKWRKDLKNWSHVPDPQAFRLAGKVVCNPSMYANLKALTTRRER
jgi:hypothetical protein